MAGSKEIINIQSYRKKGAWNVGLLLFGVVFLYLAVTVITFLTKDRVTAYEVREGSILNDTSFTGFVIRQEHVVTADSDGYVNYFTEPGQKEALGNNVCTLSPSPLDTPGDTQENAEVALGNEDWAGIALKVQSFNESYQPQNFKTVSNLKAEIQSVIQNHTTQNKVTQLNTLIESGNTQGLTVLTAPEDGVVEYSIDGYEGLELQDISEEHLSKENYTRVDYTDNTKVKAGEPLYKLITGEEWTVVIKLTKELEDQYNAMYDADQQKYAQVRFAKDDQTLWAKLDIYNRGKDDAYGYLTFSTSMIRYANDRYLDIELILKDESGLKIPKSSVVSKDFYVVPDTCLTTGGASKESGVLLQSSKKKESGVTEFVPVTVSYRDTENGLIYLDKTLFKEGDELVIPDSAETVKIGKTKALEGVYNINKGYAIFKQVHILCESEEYYIIEEGSSYGLSNYDHIALNGKSVKENDLVSQ